MPPVTVYFYAEEDGSSPVRQWLRDQTGEVQKKCFAWIERLQAAGCDLRRPDSDILGEEIHELRIRVNHLQYRILYFFDGRTAVILAHALRKENRILQADLARAVDRKLKYRKDPDRHTWSEENG